jgi:CHAT domain-containing protein/tetratricopeptide (TPR) repeat protein
VLSLLHLGLLAANQTQREPNSIDATLADGIAQRDAGHSPEAIRQFGRAVLLSRQQRDVERETRSLILLAGAHVRVFDYRSALARAHAALSLAQQTKNYVLAGAASGYITTIYMQVGDFPSAEQQVSRTIDLLERAPKKDTRTQGFLVKALVIRASICLLQGKSAQGEESSQAALGLAHQSGDPALEALAWHGLATALLRQDRVSAAGKAFAKEYALRLAMHDEDGLADTKEHLAELELRKPVPDCARALRLIDEAFAASSPTFKANAQYYPIHVRAEILLKSGKKMAALSEFRRAVNSANEWRRGALPGDTTSTQTVAALHEVYADFAELAAGISLEQHDSKLLREGLEVLAENRAASLREQLTSALGRQFQLPESYFGKLSELQLVQARVTLGRNTDEDRGNLARIHAELGEIENQIGLKPDKNFLQGEKNLRRNSLRDIQNRLSSTQVLLSFCLGKERSFLWAVTGTEVSVYQLESERAITATAARWTTATRTRHAGLNVGRNAGLDLSRALFGQLASRFSEKPEWLIVGDGSLLNGVPFSNLPDISRPNGQLVANHTLRFLPSELLLLVPDRKSPALSFLGVADPIYNLADSRLTRTKQPESNEDGASISLARLVGSEKEVRTAALLSRMSDEQLLVGTRATIQNLRRSLDRSPEILHFAVHVVSPAGQGQEAALALSLKNGIPELLTSETIATYHLPGSLVVMSGCFSEQGKTLPSAGLVGLSRAWLLAGADAVLVSAWPTPDDSGRFFSEFYRHLQASIESRPAVPLANRAAIALQQAQLDMQRNKDYSSSPSFWAAYSIISKE